MGKKITIISGDGIGPEVSNAAKEVLEALGLNLVFEEKLLGLKAIEKFGTILPEETLDSIRKNKIALKGPTTTPVGTGHRSANVALRKALDLYTCIRPIKSIPGLGMSEKFGNIDLVIFRENTEGLYVGQEMELSSDLVISLRKTTKNASMRIVKAACEFAQKENRNKITIAHKANILKLGDGLFLRAAQEVSRDFPKIYFEEVIIDALCMMLVTNPEKFDLLVMENLFGDIVSDLCAGLVGGLGVVPGANIGDEYAVFEAVHGSAPDIAGKDLANPTGIIQSSIMMLRHIHEEDSADRLEKALHAVLQEESLRTRDLGGNAGTKSFTKNVIENIR